MLFILPIILCCTAQNFYLLCSVYPYTSDKTLHGRKMHIGRLVATFLWLTVHCLKPLTLLDTVLCMGGSKQCSVLYCPSVLISCITVLYESYSTVMQLIGQIQYSYALNWANTAHLGKYSAVMWRIYLRNVT